MKPGCSIPQNIRVLIFKDGDLWIAQCLEYDIAVQAKNLNELKEKFIGTINVHITSSIENNEIPFMNIPKTPDEFWELYHKDNLLEKPLKIPSPPRRKYHGKYMSEYVPKQASLALAESPHG